MSKLFGEPRAVLPRAPCCDCRATRASAESRHSCPARQCAECKSDRQSVRGFTGDVWRAFSAEPQIEPGAASALAQLLVEERDRAVPGELGGRGVEARRRVVVEAVL